MSKTVKNLLTNSYENRFADIPGAVVINVVGLNAEANNNLRTGLADKQIKVTVVKNTLARNMFKDTELAPLTDILDGPCALAYGAESVVDVARALIDKAKEIDFEFKGAVMEGTFFGPGDIEALSKYPTREEAIAQVVQVILSPASNIAGALVGGGGGIAACLDTLIDKLEKGEEIKKSA